MTTNTFTADVYGWAIIHTRVLKCISEDIAMLQTLRSVVFRQMLEPPLWNGTHTIIEGRLMLGGKSRLEALGFREIAKNSRQLEEKKE